MRGLIPAKPLFMDEFYSRYDPKPKNVNRYIYADIIKDVAGPAVNKFYPSKDALWQDDPASIHRTDVAVTVFFNEFKNRVPHDKQAPKMADVWPIENVWGMIKCRLEEDLTSIKQMKNVITKEWKNISDDKDLCKSLIYSIPKRCQAMINKKGCQIAKKDYD